MRYGRRRRSFPWGRVVITGLAVLGALTLLLLGLNWRSLLGLYRVNSVSAAVERLEGTVTVKSAELRARNLAVEDAAARLERGLADLGLSSRLTVRR